MNQVERLHLRMKELNISPSEMCRFLHVSTSRFANWKKRGSIPKEMLIVSADILKVTVTWLLTGEGPKYQSDVVQPEPKGITLEDKEILEGLKLLSPQQKKAVKLLIESIIEEKPEKPDFKEKEMREAATRAVDSRALKGRRKLSPEAREELIEQTLQEMLHSEGQLENQGYHNQTLKQKSR